MRIQASCVAENAGVAFICNSANKIELLRIDDFKPCGEIPLIEQNSKTINKLLCDKTGKLLTLIYDNGEIIVLKTSFGLSGFILTTSCVHRDVCQTGKFGAISAFAWPDGIVYQTRNRDVIRIQIESSGQIITSSLASENRILMTCNFCNIPLMIWRNVKDYSITFPDIGGSVRADFRPLAVCLNSSRLAIATEEGKLLIYQWPELVLVKEIVCRHPVISICRHAQDMFLMTDRHGNILSLDRKLQLIDSGPCSRDQFDEYPSAIFTTGKGAFYISNSKCVTLSLRAAPRRDVMSVNEIDGRRCILTYSRENGFSVIIGSDSSRPLNQSIVGKRYESEFVKFKFAWDGNSTVAYTCTGNSVTVDNGPQSSCHTMDFEVLDILYSGGLNAFLVLGNSSQIYFVTLEKSVPIQIQSARSETGTCMIANCGEYICIVAKNVFCKPTIGNAYTETVMTLHRLSVSAQRVVSELVEIQHLDNIKDRPVGGLSYHASSNSLYLDRRGIVERWQLDDPKRLSITSSVIQISRAGRSICAYENGIFSFDENNQLKYYDMELPQRNAELASFRTITFLIPTAEKYGYLVEDNQYIFMFTIEE